MTIDELSELVSERFGKLPNERGFNGMLVDFTGASRGQVEQWKKRKRVPDGWARFIRYKVRVLEAVL